MDKLEFSLFAAAMKTYYPKESLLPNSKAMELWFRQLQDIPYQVAEAALNKWVATNKWSPSIAEIREQSATIQIGEIPDWAEGWMKVEKAIRKFGQYRESDALGSFDDLTRRTVERLGFRNLCISENVVADRANFRMIYEQLESRQKQDAQLPQDLHNAINAINNQISLKGGTE